MNQTLRIVPATERDVTLISRMIKDLAECEWTADQVMATEPAMREALFFQN